MQSTPIRYIFWTLVFFLTPSLLLTALIYLHFSDLYLLLASSTRLAAQAGVLFYLTKSTTEKTLPRLKNWQRILISIGGTLIALAMLSELIEWCLEKYMYPTVCEALNQSFAYGCKLIALDFSLAIVFLAVLALSAWCKESFARRTSG